VHDSSSSLESTPSGLRGQRLAAVVVGGAGAVAAGVGAVLAFSANSTYDSSNPHCTPDNFCDAEGIDSRNSAMQKGRIATGLLIGGGVAFAAGVGLWLTAPSGRTDRATAPRLRVSAGALPGSSSVVLSGTW
jgi:hypothetical protein